MPPESHGPGVSSDPPALAAPHPHGSLVEQVHRVWTTDQGVDAWVLAEETVRFMRERVAREIEAMRITGSPSIIGMVRKVQQECADLAREGAEYGT